MKLAQIKARILPGRKIEGMSAVLLPFDARGGIDFDAFTQNFQRTLAAGLEPAVNMDTGYTNLLTADERRAVLQAATAAANGARFVAGAFVEGERGEPAEAYRKAIAEIEAAGGLPILFQCSAIKRMSSPQIVDFYRSIAKDCAQFLLFELGEMFAPFGSIYALETVRELMQLPQIIGMKHSSLDRELEWERLAVRDEIRPEFKVYTGNDLAIDMVIYGSDYLLGLSAFAPEAFAARDAWWEASDPRFYELNDLLQYLGFFAFRPPVPAYKHTAAQFLHLRGRIATNRTHPQAQTRPESDLAILTDISDRLDRIVPR